MGTAPTKSAIPERLHRTMPRPGVSKSPTQHPMPGIPPPLPTHRPDPGAFSIPRMRLEVRDLAHPGAIGALSAIHFPSCVERCARDVLALLYLHPAEPTTTVPGTRSVTFVLATGNAGVAHTTATELDDDHKEIHVSMPYVAAVTPPERLAPELRGVLTHELVHCFQYNARGTCPGGLIEGIADWVRLRCGHAPSHWRRRAAGCCWDAGYETTAYFLDFLEQQCGEGTVRRINDKLRVVCQYEEAKFWPELLGVSIQDLWSSYAASLDA